LHKSGEHLIVKNKPLLRYILRDQEMRYISLKTIKEDTKVDEMIHKTN